MVIDCESVRGENTLSALLICVQAKWQVVQAGSSALLNKVSDAYKMGAINQGERSALSSAGCSAQYRSTVLTGKTVLLLQVDK